MSERTINENNKLWEAAEKIAEEAVAAKKAASEEERRRQKKRIVKILLLMILIALIIVFASIAWFAMNKAVSADTMAIEAKDASFEIAVKGSAVRNNTEMELADSGVRVIYFPYTKGVSSTKINEALAAMRGEV